MGTDRQDWIAARGHPLRGSVRVPGDKSISHRAIMLAAIADGTSTIDGFLEAEDTLATAAAFAAMGVRIETPSPAVRRVHGVGVQGLQAPGQALDCGNAGTAMRLLSGLLAGQPFDTQLTGDASLSRRPMQRVIEPLQAMGARIDCDEGRPPLHLHGGRALHGIDYALPVASAQVKSALLLAGLSAAGDTSVREPNPTRDYTERMLRRFGVEIAFAPGHARLRGGQRLTATDIIVPSDFSSAAFFIVAATIIPGSELRLHRVGINPRRTGLLTVLRAMGADITEIPIDGIGDEEPVADLLVRHAPLRGVDVPSAVVADMIDEFPVLFIAAACARGTTRIHGAGELRHKESDRLASMVAGLRALGAEAEERPDGAVVQGGHLRGGRVASGGDHRVAMAFAVAAQVSSGSVRIADVANVATSFPDFETTSRGVGFSLQLV